MSDFIYVFRAGAATQREAMGIPDQAERIMLAWMKWMRGLETAGHLRTPGQPLAPEGKVIRGPQRTVTDGPLVEVQDLVAGFLVIEARDMEQAVALTAGCPILQGGGSVEIRPVMKI